MSAIGLARVCARLTAVVLAVVLCGASVALASLSSANARSATRSERAGLVSTFAKEDGNASEIRGVYVDRSNSALAVVCARTPEAGIFAYVFARSHGRWRYATSGRPGHSGSSRQRRLERAC
jgi:hypothetical protein